MKRLLTVFVGLAILLGTVFGCRMNGKKTHLAENSPYVNARTGQLIEQDSSDDGLLDFFFDGVSDAIFGTTDKD